MYKGTDILVSYFEERFLEIDDKYDTSEVVKSYIKQLRCRVNNVATKCELCKGCKEPCNYVVKHALDRRV